ncbi:MAG: hypothetical protein FVQ82_01245 [Planctomycetes bacterium]|nr:hypothetical protein [Planctomycetota bacterium]
MAIGSARSSSNLQLDYMNLLVTQLQNQNPLEPMSNGDMAAQLAQFSQLEQLERLNQSFDQVLENTQRSFANDIIGKKVSFIDMDSTNSDGVPGVVRSGQVLKMDMLGDTEMLRVAEVDPANLMITEYTIDAEKVTSVMDPFNNP